MHNIEQLLNILHFLITFTIINYNYILLHNRNINYTGEFSTINYNYLSCEPIMTMLFGLMLTLILLSLLFCNWIH